MITEYGVLKPDVPRPAAPGQEAHEHWRQEHYEKYPDWKQLDPKYNIRFMVPDHLLHKVLSIKAARPGPNQHWLWVGVGALFQSGVWSYTLGAAMMAASAAIAGFLEASKAVHFAPGVWR